MLAFRDRRCGWLQYLTARFAHATILACLVFMFACRAATFSRADPLEDAAEAFNRGDAARGIEILNSAAALGDAAMQYRIGTALLNHSEADAVRWYESAAEQGYGDAQRDMGLAYAVGLGVKQDLVKSYFWYSLALRGNPEASWRENAMRNMEGVYAAMSPAERAAAQQLIDEWKPR